MDLVRYLKEQRETTESLAGELSDLPAAAATGSVEVLRLLLSTIDDFGAGQASEHDLNGRVRAAANRSQDPCSRLMGV